VQVIPLEGSSNTGRTGLFQTELKVDSSALKAVDIPESEGRAALQFAYPADGHKIFVPHM